MGGSEISGPDVYIPVTSDQEVTWHTGYIEVPGYWRHAPAWATCPLHAEERPHMGSYAVAPDAAALRRGELYADLPAEVAAAVRWTVAVDAHQDARPAGMDGVDELFALRRALYPEEPIVEAVRAVLTGAWVLVCAGDGQYTPSHVAAGWAAHHGPAVGYRVGADPIVRNGGDQFVAWALDVCGRVPHTMM